MSEEKSTAVIDEGERRCNLAFLSSCRDCVIGLEREDTRYKVQAYRFSVNSWSLMVFTASKRDRISNAKTVVKNPLVPVLLVC